MFFKFYHNISIINKKYYYILLIEIKNATINILNYNEKYINIFFLSENIKGNSIKKKFINILHLKIIKIIMFFKEEIRCDQKIYLYII